MVLSVYIYILQKVYILKQLINMHLLNNKLIKTIFMNILFGQIYASFNAFSVIEVINFDIQHIKL